MSISKIAFIGTHGVGKTTLCYGLAARLKARDVALDVVGEVARRCPLPINRGTTLAAQSWILHTQIAAEINAAERNDLVICDRSVLDNYVYLLVATGSQKQLEDLIEHWTATYDMLVHVPISDVLRADGLRSTDPVFQRTVEERLMDELVARGLGYTELHNLPRDGWLDHVEEEAWKRLRPHQLELI
jgi:nicotinamide riboside kinase